jgi:succinate dehydrogenase/fumarate reductase cytochrome b subunit
MKRWFDLRRRSAGLWAFRLHRLSGIGLWYGLDLTLAVIR